MKKKIAVYANGWSNDALMQAMQGIRRYAAKEDADVFVFLSFASYSEHAGLNQGELNIYKLGYMEEFDGVIVFSTMLNSNGTAVSLCKLAKEKKLPVVSIGMEIDGVPSICVDNDRGMHDLVTHLVEEHHIKKVLFMGGTPDHVDSIARLRVTREVLEAHGIELNPNQVCYGDWGNNGPIAIVDGLVESGVPMPDAIICANDIMALATSAELIRRGYSLPKDVIVTGFDDIDFGRITYPALSTVRQNYEEIGFRSAEMIYDQLYGREMEEKVLIPASFVLGESCGCKAEGRFERIRLQYCMDSYQRHLDSTGLEINERVMRQRISEMRSYDGLRKNLQDFFFRNHLYEGTNYYIVLHSEYFEDAMADERDLIKRGVSDDMEVIVALRDGQNLPVTTVNRKVLIPAYEKAEGEQHVYYLSPLHHFEYNYGYAVFVDEPHIIKEDLLYAYMEKIQQSLRLLRINLRLDTLNKDLTRIYDKDPMTGLFNRFAYESKAIPLFEESVRDKKSMMVMFVDINYMKRINDEFGHDHGDNAIKTVAESIMTNVRENWIPVRFGGDEFLVIAPDCDEKEASLVRQAILDYLDRRNNDGSQPYRITASCGYVVTDPASNVTLQDYVKEADKLMYENKQKVHAKDKTPRYEA